MTTKYIILDETGKRVLTYCSSSHRLELPEGGDWDDICESIECPCILREICVGGTTYRIARAAVSLTTWGHGVFERWVSVDSVRWPKILRWQIDEVIEEENRCRWWQCALLGTAVAGMVGFGYFGY
jgi:hypothetical protein